MSARIVVVGGGPVGLAFAVAASGLPGISVQVLERAADTWSAPPQQRDHRVYALSPASVHFLQHIGVELPPERIAPVRGMQVWGDSASEREHRLDLANGQPLAWIVEHAALMYALTARLERDSRVHVQRGVHLTAFERVGAQTALITKGGIRLEADLLIAADGKQSKVRDWAGIASTVKDYESDGLVGNFRCERPHGDIARQWFTSQGVLALLPLPGNEVSMVWSVGRALSLSLPTNDETEVARMVMQESRHALGRLEHASPFERFALSRISAQDWVQPGLALMGDSAHAVHPLAGQGVNLGFGDATALCELLRTRTRYSSTGDVALLRRYERSRREAAWAVGEVTDRLRSLYLSDAGIAKWLRNPGLDILNRIPPAKSQLVDYAAG